MMMKKKEMKYASAKQIAEKQQRGFDLTTLDLPSGVSLFQFKEEKVYRLAVVPFKAKKGNPNCDPGYYTWERTYFAHDGVGPDNQKFTCPYKHNGGRCPIHDHAAKLRRQGGDADLIDALEKPKKRQVIAVVDLDNRDKGVQCYEGPYFNGLGMIIDNKIDGSDEDSPYRGFFTLDGMMKLSVKVKKEGYSTKGGKSGTFMKPVNVEMEPLDPKVVAKVIPDDLPEVDDWVKALPYDDLKKKFLQEDDEGGPSGGTDDEDDDKLDPDDGGEPEGLEKWMKPGAFCTWKGKECKILDVKSSGLVLEDDNEDEHEGVPPSRVKKVELADDEDSDDDGEEDAQEKKPSGKKHRDPDEDEEEDEDSEDEDSDGEEDEEEEETKPAARKRRK